METQHEPKFFLQDELIYFLQKNMTITTEFVPTKTVGMMRCNTSVQICEKEICNSSSAIALDNILLLNRENLKFASEETKNQLDEQRKFMHELTLHVQRQEKQIESLSKALAQYDRPI